MSSDEILLRKFREILEMSQEIKKTEVAEYLGITEKELFAKLVEWRNLGFKIKGEFIVVDDTKEFLAALDRQYASWNQAEALGKGKQRQPSTIPPETSPPRPLSPRPVLSRQQITPIRAPIIKREPETSSYQGAILINDQCSVMMDIEKILGNPVPRSDLIRYDSFGFIDQDKQVTALGIYNKNMKMLPTMLGNLISLDFLAMGYNSIQELPRSLGQLKKLQKLLLTDNKISTLPDTIGNLRALYYLNLNGNKIAALPETLPNLSSLKLFYVSHNLLTALPQNIGNLRTLNFFDLGKNALTNLPESMGQLTSLETLDLHDNHLESLPETIGSLVNLKRLNLQRNYLKNLPASFGNLSNIEELGLNGNQFKALPEELLRLKHLRYICVDVGMADTKVGKALKKREPHVSIAEKFLGNQDLLSVTWSSKGL